jgi:hypothetical protein
MKKNITNCYISDEKRTKLESEMIYIYQPKSGWMYSHHPHITWFNDRFIAIWSNGRCNEDDVGQRVLISTSEDYYHWSAPIPLVDSMPGKYSEVVLTAAGFHTDNDSLVAYIGKYEYKPERVINNSRLEGDDGHMDTTVLALTTKDGLNWNQPTDLKIPIVPNHGPQKIMSGRLIISGNIMFPYSDDPSGLKGWKTTGIYPKSFENDIFDDSEGLHIVNKMMNREVQLCEGSFYQTDDEVIHMMLRSNTEKLWVTESYDNGMTWDEPKITDFTDNSTKFHFGRLSDGRFYYVGSPDPEPRWARNPLVLSLSHDGICFNKHYILKDETYVQSSQGLYKGGCYGYPHTIEHDGYLYVTFSLAKEGIAVIRLNIKNL